MDALYPKTTAGASPSRACGDNWFVALFRRGETSSYLKVTCRHPPASISTEMTVPGDTLEKHRGLFRSHGQQSGTDAHA